MARWLVLLLAAPAAVGGSLWFAVLPEWHFLQLVALPLAAVGAGFLMGKLGAGFVSVGMLALQGSDTSSESGFFVVVLPLIAVLCLGGLIACLLLRCPSLGRQIEHGPLGPGGI